MFCKNSFSKFTTLPYRLQIQNSRSGSIGSTPLSLMCRYHNICVFATGGVRPAVPPAWQPSHCQRDHPDLRDHPGPDRPRQEDLLEIM